MENNTAIWEARIAETEALIRLLTATGASKKRLAVLRRELEVSYDALRTIS